MLLPRIDRSLRSYSLIAETIELTQNTVYICLGNQPFGPIAIKTRAPTLIPRPETEDWTIRLASLLDDRFPVEGGGKRTALRTLDLCTGTGCIPILLSYLRRQAGGITVACGVDISTDAVSLARENATDQSLSPSRGPGCVGSHCDDDPEATTKVVETGEAGGRANHERGTAGAIATSAADGGGKSTLDVMRADILQEDFVQVVLSRTETPFDVITSNPPYIPLGEYERLPNSVKEWEDQRALLGDLPTHGSGDGSKGRGLMFYHRIAQIVSADGVLAAGGIVALEVGHTQAEEVREILGEIGGVSATEVWKDPWGVPRVVVGYR
jgi:release factor glutamine methyltransferase